MNTEILAIAVIMCHPGREDDALALLRELYAMMNAKGYCRDLLYRDSREPRRYIHLRYWASEAARGLAQEDPDVHKFWRRLADLCEIQVYDCVEQLI